jgi:DNA-directed RNA polymerase specialized sigma24 family protein
MVSSTASTRQPPAGGPKATVDLDSLLLELRQGDRDAFVRYFRLFRAPVHHAAWLLLGDEPAAAAATREAFAGAFRRAILDEDLGDLEVLTYSCLLEACEGQAAGAPGAGRSGVLSEQGPGREQGARRRRHARGDDLRQRFGAALDALEPRQRASLVLHDVARLDATRAAAVLGVAAEAAAALQFRAREEFRAGLHDGAAGDACRQAEEATAGAVGRGLDEEELLRLRHHAAYCRPCHRTMRAWMAGGVGLGLVLAEPLLPQALAATPVFGDGEGALSAPAGRGRAVLTSAGRALRSRAAAWSVAVLCLAVAAGVVVHGVGVRPLVLLQSVGPAIRLIVAPSGDGAAPAEARSTGRTTRDAAGTIGISPASALSAPAASATARPSAPAGSPTPAAQRTPAASATDAPAGETVSEGTVRDAEKDTPAAGAAARAAAKEARSGEREAAKAAKSDERAAVKARGKASKRQYDSAGSKGEAAKSHGKAAKPHGGAEKAHAKATKAHAKATKAHGAGGKAHGKAGGSTGKGHDHGKKKGH